MTGEDIEARPDQQLMVRKPDGTLVSLAGRDPDDYLSAEAEALYWRGIPQSTQDIYTRQWGRFVDWCSRQPSPRAHMPARPATLIEYINAHWKWPRPESRPCTKEAHQGRECYAGHGCQPYAPETARLALKVISIAHHGFGHVSPTKDRGVRSTWRQYRDEWGARGYKTAEADMLTPDEVLRMVATCDLDTVGGIRDCLLIRLAADCGRRNQELLAVDWHNVRWVDDRRIVVTFPFSKVKRDGKPDEVGFETDDIWAPDSDPVRMFREYRELAAARGLDVQRGPVFVEARMGRRRKVGISGVLVAGQRMTRRAFQDMIVMRAEAAGVHVDPVSGDVRRIRPHSFRHFVAEELLAAGVPLQRVNRRIGWAKDSTMALRYADSAVTWGNDNPGVMMRQHAVEMREAELARTTRQEN